MTRAEIGSSAKKRPSISTNSRASSKPAKRVLIEHARSDAVVEPHRTTVEKVMAAARIAGFRAKKTQRISGRVSPKLVEQAKKHTGLTSDTDLVEFALANLALDDHFARTFRAVRGTVDTDLDLEF